MKKTISLEETPVIAVAAPKKDERHRSRIAMDQHINREIQAAMAETELAVVTMLAKAGVPVNEFPDTAEGAERLGEFMTQHDIQVNKLAYQDRMYKSGYCVTRAGIEIGIVPCRIVRGVMV